LDDGGVFRRLPVFLLRRQLAAAHRIEVRSCHRREVDHSDNGDWPTGPLLSPDGRWLVMKGKPERHAGPVAELYATVTSTK